MVPYLCGYSSLSTTLRWLTGWLALTDWEWLCPPGAHCSIHALQCQTTQIHWELQHQCKLWGSQAELWCMCSLCLLCRRQCEDNQIDCQLQLAVMTEKPVWWGATCTVTRKQLLCTKSSNQPLGLVSSLSISFAPLGYKPNIEYVYLQWTMLQKMQLGIFKESIGNSLIFSFCCCFFTHGWTSWVVQRQACCSVV